MDITAYKALLKKPLSLRTSCFLMKDSMSAQVGNDSLTNRKSLKEGAVHSKNEMVLLGLKKRGFGKGYYVGIGGKVEKDETIEQALVREVQEEVGVLIKQFTKFATISYYFPYVANEIWNMQVFMFVANSWDGEIAETEEIKPEWFSISRLPLEKMWDDAKVYLPKIIERKKFTAEFFYDSSNKRIFDHSITDNLL